MRALRAILLVVGAPLLMAGADAHHSERGSHAHRHHGSRHGHERGERVSRDLFVDLANFRPPPTGGAVIALSAGLSREVWRFETPGSPFLSGVWRAASFMPCRRRAVRSMH